MDFVKDLFPYLPLSPLSVALNFSFGWGHNNLLFCCWNNSDAFCFLVWLGDFQNKFSGFHILFSHLLRFNQQKFDTQWSRLQKHNVFPSPCCQVIVCEWEDGAYFAQNAAIRKKAVGVMHFRHAFCCHYEFEAIATPMLLHVGPSWEGLQRHSSGIWHFCIWCFCIAVFPAF